MIGASVGSFLNVVIYRLPKNESVVTPRSTCPSCHKLIAWYYNIPIFSWLYLRGKCAYCKSKISIEYLLVELFTGIVFILLLPSTTHSSDLLRFVFLFSIFCIFLCHIIIDIKYQILPDSLNLYLLAIILPYSIMNYHYTYWGLGALIGFGGTYLLTYAFYKLRGVVGLGGGDIKLFGILGLLLGPMGILANIFMSSFIGALGGLVMIYIKKQDKNMHFAFGPYILIVAALQVYFPQFYSLINPFSLN